MSDDDSEAAPEFWAPRACFLTPIPEIEVAACLIDAAADAFLKASFDEAEELIAQADFPEIGEFFDRIAGPTDPRIHRVREVRDAPGRTASRVSRRMPPAGVEREVFARDGWRCRFCGMRIVAKKAIRVLNAKFPEVLRWSKSNAEKHSAFRAMCCSLDHVLPHSRGGSNDPDNLVAACGPCQFGRNQWTLEEVGLSDPRLRPPVVDSWDGLVRVCESHQEG